jgi:hypothetical protein
MSDRIYNAVRIYSFIVTGPGGASQGCNDHPSFAVHVQNSGEQHVQLPVSMTIKKKISLQERQDGNIMNVLTLSSTLWKMRRRPSVLEKAGVGRWGGGAVCFFLQSCTRSGIAGSRVASTPVAKAAAAAAGGWATLRCAGGVRQQLM